VGSLGASQIVRITKDARDAEVRTVLGCGLLASHGLDGAIHAAAIQTSSFCWSSGGEVGCGQKGWYYDVYGPAGKKLLLHKESPEIPGWPKLTTVLDRYLVWQWNSDLAADSYKAIIVDSVTGRKFATQHSSRMLLHRDLLLYELSTMHLLSSMPQKERTRWYAKHQRCFNLRTFSEMVVPLPE